MIDLPKIEVVGDSRFTPHHKNGDAAIDLRVDRNIILTPGSFVEFDTHVKVTLPKLMCGLLLPRSGLSTGKLNTVGAKVRPTNVGLIDPSYEGTIKGVLENVGTDTAKIKKFDRVAQLLIVPFVVPNNVDSDQYFRADTGFGHSGTD